MPTSTTRLLLATLAACVACTAHTEAADLDPWHHDAPGQWEGYVLADLLDHIAAADPAAELVLCRCRMNGLESAQYSLADHALRRGDAKGAIALLTQVADAASSPDLRSVTRYNLAEIARRRLRDVAAARKHYAQVKGLLRHHAHSRNVGLLIEVGKLDEAAKAAEAAIAKATGKGARLALLHALARAYARYEMPDRAAAAYQRITREFSRKDIQAILAAATTAGTDAARRIWRLTDLGQDEDDLWETLVEQHLDELRAAGRWDEYHAFETAAVSTWNQFCRDEDNGGHNPRGTRPLRKL